MQALEFVFRVERSVDSCGAGHDQDGVGAQKAALAAAWKRGLEIRRRGACLVGGEGRGKVAAKVSGSFEATYFSLCLSMVCPESPVTRAGTASAMGASPLPGASVQASQVLKKHFAVH